MWKRSFVPLLLMAYPLVTMLAAAIRAYRSEKLSEVPRSVVGGHFPEPFSSSLALLERHQLNLFSEGWSQMISRGDWRRALDPKRPRERRAGGRR